jgi:hypothetical protein
VWTPLISARAFQAKRKAPKQAEPVDLFGDLSEPERAQLRQAVKLL